MLPCLQELDLSNTDRGDEMQFASFPCSDCLEKLTWNGLSECHYYSFGISLKQRIPNIKKVKDISVDDYLSLDVSLKALASLSACSSCKLMQYYSKVYRCNNIA